MAADGSGSGTIADVIVDSGSDATTVTLVGLEEPIFTAFSEQDPERVVIDLASVTGDDVMGAIPVADGLVDLVRLMPFATDSGEAMFRVEIDLAEAADYDVVPTAEGLAVKIAPEGAGWASEDGDSASDDPWAMDAEQDDAWAMDGEQDDAWAMDAGDEQDDPWAMDAEEDSDDPWAMAASGEESEDAGDPWELPAEDEMAEPMAAVPTRDASRLEAIEARQTGEGSLVHLKADGAIASAETFTLEEPARLVVDLPGLVSAMEGKRIEVGSPQAEAVRIGQHDDMVRVVIDAGSAAEPFQGRRVLPAASGLVIALGTGPQLDWAVEEIMGQALVIADAEPSADDGWLTDGMEGDSLETADADPMFEAMDSQGESLDMMGSEEPADDGGPALIYGVEFDSQAERDRIVVMSEKTVDYLLYEPAPDTVVVSIQQAKIDPDAAVRIAPDPGGPVSLVTAFEQPDTQADEVRVVVKRADGLKPQISRQGSLIVVDFPREGMAEMPPVLAATGEPMGADPVTADPMGADPMAAAPMPIDGGEPMAMPAAAAPAPMGAAPAVATTGAMAPAALDSPAAIDVLQEGGLMDGKQYTGRRVSLDFKEIDMSDVLRLIAEVSDLNVIAGEEVSGKVTIRLVEVPWDQALDVILLTKGLGFVRVGNVLRIAPADVLKQEEEMRLQERRALEQLEDLVVKLQPVNYADVNDVKGTVQRLLSSRGTVDVDKRTNTLIIKDIPSVIDESTALVKAIDTQTPQVLIESKIVEASLDFSREFGTTWGFGAQPLNDGFDPASGQRRDLGSDAFRLHNSENSGFFGNNAEFINPLTAGPTALFNIAGFLLDEKLNLELQLQAAEINGDGKVISSPRVVTLDNVKATIEQGVSIPFQTFENGDAQLEFVDAVLKLDVTPHITADRSIIMKVKVSRNAPDDSVFTLTGSPAIAKNQVDTETLVKDGQTLVIGGIYVVDKSQRQSRVPYLHAIPLLGGLFRSDEVSDNRKELLIFVTPRVVAAAQAAS
ncbi:MAG: type IV pilus secretin PilQ [Myxococcota bacterium]|nr:type IV pilus secretin PilQ [Myxococcota bacterium]